MTDLGILTGRPRRLVVITGTGTDIGKTWVAAAVAAQLGQRGLGVTARKPAQSFDPADAENLVTDAHLLAQATGEAPEAVCPSWRWYPRPLAPPMAAEALGRPPFGIDDLSAELSAGWPEAALDIGLVEGAGGVASPLAADGDMTALIAAVAPELVVLVADAALGCVNSVRLSMRALQGRPTVVHLNRFQPGLDLHRRNLDWLDRRDGFDVTTDIAALASRVGGR